MPVVVALQWLPAKYRLTDHLRRSRYVGATRGRDENRLSSSPTGQTRLATFSNTSSPATAQASPPQSSAAISPTSFPGAGWPRPPWPPPAEARARKRQAALNQRATVAATAKRSLLQDARTVIAWWLPEPRLTEIDRLRSLRCPSPSLSRICCAGGTRRRREARRPPPSTGVGPALASHTAGGAKVSQAAAVLRISRHPSGPGSTRGSSRHCQSQRVDRSGPPAGTKRALDLLRDHSPDRRLLVQVMRLLRDRDALRGGVGRHGLRPGTDGQG